MTRIGSDLTEAMRLQLERLERGGITTAYVDLPLSRPETPSACDELERLGFFFAGVFPSGEDSGWRLRLQHLDAHAEASADDIEVASSSPPTSATMSWRVLPQLEFLSDYGRAYSCRGHDTCERWGSPSTADSADGSSEKGA